MAVFISDKIFDGRYTVDPPTRVCIKRTLADGITTCEWVTPLAASVEAIASPQNGVTVASLRVLWGDVLDEFTRSI
jgi:hypothetical protein